MKGFISKLFGKSGQGSDQPHLKASDQWEHYLAQMGEHQASIFYNEGLSSILPSSDYRFGLRVKIKLNDPNSNGFPTDQEFPKLSEVDEKIEDAIERFSGLYLGRITVNGIRWIFILFSRDVPEVAAQVEVIGKKLNYELSVDWGPDPDHELYWKDLYPSEDDRQVLEDLKVIGILREHGDCLEKERPIYHWSYFESKELAEVFAVWLGSENYKEIEIVDESQEGGKLPWQVKSENKSAVKIGSISKHTLALSRKAKSLGGEYDGWETQVTKSEE